MLCCSRSVQQCVVLLFTLALLFGQAFSPARADGHERALLIGVSTYDHYNKTRMFPNLNCEEDLRRIQAALVKTFGFDPSKGEISILDNLHAPALGTREAILNAFQRLVRDTQPGDIVYIHYSGHGSQVLDPTKPGGLESTLVPADYRNDQTSEETSHEVSGRTIAGYLKQMRAKKPSQIVLSFDACHSAADTRGYALKRGLTYAECRQWAQQNARPLPPMPKAHESATTRGAQPAMEDLTGSGYVVLAACTNDTCAYECKDGGATLGRFSDCLAQVLSHATPTMTYQQVYQQVRAMFKQRFPDQEPQIDGDPNTDLFGGAARPPRPTMLVSLRDGRYLLDAGKLQGMTVGSALALFTAGAAELTAGGKIADATISHVHLTESELQITAKRPGFSKAALLTEGAQAVETTHRYIGMQIVFDATSVRQAAPADAPAVLAKLSDLRMVTTVPTERAPDIRMVRRAAHLYLARADTGARLTGPLDESGDLPAQVHRALRRQAQRFYATTVLNKEDPNSDIQIRLRIVPAETTTNDDGELVWKADRKVNADAPFHVGDYFTIEVQNTGATAPFVIVLDIDSDGGIAQVWPSLRHPIKDNVVQVTMGDAMTGGPAVEYLPGASPGWIKLWSGSDTKTPQLLRFSAADEDEIYKAIATDVHVDLAPLTNRDMGAFRGAVGPFDDLLAPAVGGATRDSNAVTSPSTWATAAFPCSVAP